MKNFLNRFSQIYYLRGLCLGHLKDISCMDSFCGSTLLSLKLSSPVDSLMGWKHSITWFYLCFVIKFCFVFFTLFSNITANTTLEAIIMFHFELMAWIKKITLSNKIDPSWIYRLRTIVNILHNNITLRWICISYHIISCW